MFGRMEMAMKMNRINTIYKEYTIQSVLADNIKVTQLRALVPDNEKMVDYDYDAECVEPEPAVIDIHMKIPVIQKPRMVINLLVTSSKKRRQRKSTNSVNFSPSGGSESSWTSTRFKMKSRDVAKQMSILKAMESLSPSKACTPRKSDTPTRNDQTVKLPEDPSLQAR